MTGPRRPMASKRTRRLVAEPPPVRSARPRPPRRGNDQVLIVVLLLVVGGLAGAGLLGLMQGHPSSTTPGATEPAATDDTGGAGDNTLGSNQPQDSTQPVSPILESRMPATIDDVSLTSESAVDATTLSSGPDGRALDAAVVHLGKQASDLEVAIAQDQTGTIDLQILGFRVNGVGASTMRDIVMSAWLSAGTPGVTSTTLSWAGTNVTKISYGDQGPDEYVLTIGDSVYIVETTDAGNAQAAGIAILDTAGAAPSSPTGSAPAASTTPAAS